MHAWKLCDHQHQQHNQVQPQRLPPAQINMTSRLITDAQMHIHPENTRALTGNVSDALKDAFLQL